MGGSGVRHATRWVRLLKVIRFLIATLATTRMASFFPLELLAIVCDPQLSQSDINIELAKRNLTTLVCDILSLCLRLEYSPYLDLGGRGQKKNLL